MSNERPNEFLPWRAQLTKPDALPEQGVDDKELSWQRLAERLHRQPRRLGIKWWIAAACLILAFFFPATHLFRTRPTHPNRVALHPSAKPQPVISVKPQPVTPTKPQPVGPAPPPPTAPAQPQLPTLASARPRSVHPSHPPLLLPAPDPVLITPPPLTPAASPILAATPPPRRLLRVAYLNEINNPGPYTVRTPRQPAFISLGTAAEYTVTNNSPIVRIDISSPNH